MTKPLIALVLVLLAGYGLMEAWPLLSGPSLSFSAPLDERTATGTVTVSGHVARAVALTLNGAEVTATESGTFSVERTYPKGIATLSLAATDRFGRTITKTRTIFVQ
jgi:hypothetical protein